MVVRVWCLLVAVIGLGGLAVGRGPGLGLPVALAGFLWGLGWLTVSWYLLPDPAARVVQRLALVAGTLLVLSSLSWAGWLPVSVANRSGAVALVAVLPLLWIFYPSRPLFLVRVTSVPVAVAAGLAVALLPQLSEVLDVVGLVMAVLTIAAIWWRLERGVRQERDTVLWLVCALGVSVLVVVPLAFLGGGPVSALLMSLTLLVVCLATILGLRPPRNIDIRVLILRLSVNAVAVLLVLAVFAGVGAGLRLSTGLPPSLGMLALVAAAISVAFPLVRRSLDGVLGRLLFGDRVNALEAASRFGEELSSAEDLLLPLRALRQVLWLPYAALVDTPVPEVASGTEPVEGTYRLTLRVGDAVVGSLVLGLRPGEYGPGVQDRDLLRFVVPTLAQAVHARALAAELARSRGRVVSAVEDERRRLRHDLHDGLGPALTGVAYAADAARNHLHTHPERTEELLVRLAVDTREAVTEIRRLVDGLRPSALDQLGLVGALRQHSTHLYTAGGDRLQVGMEVVEPLPALPAAAEVAAYRIVAEALTNVARHADADHARVQIQADGSQLSIQVIDYGSADEIWSPGVGLSSMRERAEQLGGTFSAGATSDGGRVTASLPLG